MRRMGPRLDSARMGDSSRLGAAPPEHDSGPPMRWAPMLATPSYALPPPGQDDRWAYEFKWDGVRILCRVGGDGGLWLFSRTGREVTGTYPELTRLGPELGRAAVLDGEVVALDPRTGRPSFGTLQQRMHLSRASDIDRLLTAVPVTFLVFDVLSLDDRDLTGRPYRERREILDGLGLRGPSWQTPPAFTGGGADVLAASKAGGLEGVVAKRLDSPYRSGRRSEEWLKVKNLRARDVVVGGWTAGRGRRQGGVGALMLGVPDGAALRYVGNVGTGFTDKALDQLATRLAPLAAGTSPFTDVPRAQARDAHWVRPELVGEVVYVEATAEGRLRHPVWRGLRSDISPGDVTSERG